MTVDSLKAPFPWFGGKSRAAGLIWPRFGDPANFAEPFAGSLAVLLARPHAPRIETVNDLDCFVANFWRAITADPEQVARFADGPVNEADLHARHRWLVDRAEFRARMRVEPDYFDAKIAGWWVWGLCAWIGSGWCSFGAEWKQVPHLGNEGRGVHSKAMRGPAIQLPSLGGSTNSKGGNANYGGGVHSKATRSRILEVFVALSERLRYTRVACGDWRRILSDSVTWRHGTTAILLDPPYAEGDEVYSEGGNSTFADVATWAAEHGTDERLRICLCGYAGTWAPPDGWVTVEWKAKGGYGSQSKKEGGDVNAARERLWFSPGCLRPEVRAPQASLFDFAEAT